jgi:hypothetical protein
MENVSGVWAITTISSADFPKGHRTPGVVRTLEEATELIEGNYGDIYEFSYDYAVAEFVPFGLYSLQRRQVWFRWQHDKYVNIGSSVPDGMTQAMAKVGFGATRMANWSGIG